MTLTDLEAGRLGALASFLDDLATDERSPLQGEPRAQMRGCAELLRTIVARAGAAVSVEEAVALTRLQGYAETCWRPSGRPMPDWMPLAFRAIERIYRIQ